MIHKFSIYVLDHFTLDLTLRLLALFSCLICESKFSGVLVSAFLIRKKVVIFMSKELAHSGGESKPKFIPEFRVDFHLALWRRCP